MAHYLVKARAHSHLLDELKALLDDGAIRSMRPFGKAMDYSLEHARLDPDGWAVWEEEDYCQPPLAMEREAVLDRFFADLTVEAVERGRGWDRIESLPSLWEERPSA